MIIYREYYYPCVFVNVFTPPPQKKRARGWILNRKYVAFSISNFILKKKNLKHNKETFDDVYGYLYGYFKHIFKHAYKIYAKTYA